jgi:hypothetical protein
MRFSHCINVSSNVFSFTHQALSVLTNNQHVKFFLAWEGSRLDRGDGTNVGIKIEVLAQSNNWGRVACNFVGWRAYFTDVELKFGTATNSQHANKKYLTAPKRAPLHSFFKWSMVS